jgi:tyrosine-protein kinase Etk/Wzc
MPMSVVEELEISSSFLVPQPRLDTLRLMVRHRRILVVVGTCAAVIAAVVALLTPPTFTATARLLPPQQNQSLASLFMGQTGNSAFAAMAQKDLGIKNPADIYIGLLNSRSIQDGLIEQFELGRVYGSKRPTDTRTELTRRTRIQMTKEGLIAVAVQDRDPNRAAAVANGYAEQLRRTTKRLALTEAAQRRQFFDEQVQQVRDELSAAEAAFRQVQQRTGILQVDAQARVLIESAAALRAQISAGEVELRAMRNFATEENPDIRQHEEQLRGWRAQLAQLESQRSPDAAFSKGRAPAEVLEYARAMREVRYSEAVLEMLLRQREAAKLDEAKEATIIQVVDAAVPPDVKTSPKRTLIVLFATMAAVILAVCVLRVQQRFAYDVQWQARCAQLRADWQS